MSSTSSTSEDEKDSSGKDEQSKDASDSSYAGAGEPSEYDEDISVADEQSEDEKNSYPSSLATAQHIVVKVSVAVSRSVAPTHIQEEVAKVTTNVIRSYTPYLVYMFDVGRARRELQPTRLEYDPKFSSASLAAQEAQESWWAYNVAYKVTAGAEEAEETNEIEVVAQSATEDAILSGLFEQLLSQISPEVVGVAIPGGEMNRPVSDDAISPPNEGNTAQPSLVGIGLAVICFGVVFCIVSIFVVAHQRRKRRANQALAIPLGEQKEKGRIVSAEWEASVRSVYSGERMSGDAGKGGLILSPSGSSYMLDSWDQGTYDGTAEGTDEITALSFDSESFRSLT
jgi:hypothetical protein